MLEECVVGREMEGRWRQVETRMASDASYVGTVADRGVCEQASEELDLEMNVIRVAESPSPLPPLPHPFLR